MSVAIHISSDTEKDVSIRYENVESYDPNVIEESSPKPSYFSSEAIIQNSDFVTNTLEDGQFNEYSNTDDYSNPDVAGYEFQNSEGPPLSKTSNNGYQTASFLPGNEIDGGPDLKIEPGSFMVDQLGPGETRIRARVINIGTTPAGSFFTTVWIDWTDRPNCDGFRDCIFVMTRTEVLFPYAQDRTAVVEIDFKTNKIAPGNHHIDVHADHYPDTYPPMHSVPESDETNNWASTFFWNPTPPWFEAALTVEDISLPTTAFRGTSIDLEYSIKNNHFVDLRCWLGASMFLVGTSTPEYADETDPKDPYPGNPGLDIEGGTDGCTETYVRNFAIESSMPEGTYELVVAVWYAYPSETKEQIDVIVATSTLTVKTNLDPVADIDGLPTCYRGTSVRFYGHDSYDPDGHSFSYLWDFGDGDYSTDTNPYHTFSSTGNYRVWLTLIDELGAVGETFHDISVTIPPQTNLVVEDIWWIDYWGGTDTEITAGQEFDIWIRIRNNGNLAASTSFRITLDLDSNLYYYDCSYLGAGDNIDLHLGYVSSAVGVHNFEVEVDVLDAINEEYETDNIEQETLTVVNAEWTVIYVGSCGSFGGNPQDDLSMAIQSNVNRFKEVGSSADLNIISLTDISGIGDTRVYYYLPGSGVEFSLSSINPSWTTGELNMGDPITIATFIRFAVSTYKSDKVALFLSDHGMGIYGLMMDDQIFDWLSYDDVSYILEDVISNTWLFSFDILSLDACNTALVESSLQFKDYADILIGSERSQRYCEDSLFHTGGTLRYGEFLQIARNQPWIDPWTLAVEIVDSYVDHWLLNHGSVIFPMYYSTILTAVKLNLMENLCQKLDALSLSLSQKMHFIRDVVNISRLSSETYDIPENIDLYHFTEMLEDNIGDLEINQEITELQNSLTQAVYSRKHTGANSIPVDNAHGLGIWFPNHTTFYNMWSSYYRINLDIKDREWITFLDYFFMNPDDIPEFTLEYPTGGEYLSGHQSIQWTMTDWNNDDIQYKIYLSTNNGWTWQLIEDKHGYASPSGEGFTFEFDTTLYQDNLDCYIRIEFHQWLPDRTDGEYVGEISSGLFTFDNSAPPEITITSPSLSSICSGLFDVAWISDDPDVDEIDYSVYLSNDLGSTWYLIYSGSSFDTSLSFTVDTNQFSDYNDCRIRIYYDDGRGETGSIYSDSFTIDNNAPSNPYDIFPISDHDIDIWSNDQIIEFYLVGASDGFGSGVQGFSILWALVEVDPGTTIKTDSVHITSALLSDGYWYLNVRTIDNAGFWSSSRAIGPFKIDTSAPSNPDLFDSASHLISVWSNDNTVDVSWTGASDTLSGLAGYSIIWDHNPMTTPDEILDTSQTVITSYSLSDGIWYLHIRACDFVGNWATESSVLHIGPFFIDTTPSSSTPTYSPPDGENDWYWTPQTVSLNGFDPLSGFDEMWYSLDGVSFIQYENPLTFNEGIFELYYYSLDLAGNAESVGPPLVFMIDLQDPEVLNILPGQTVPYDAGTSGHLVTWEVYDTYQDKYTLVLDNGATQESMWTDSSIVHGIDGLEIGPHYLILTLYDQSGRLYISTVEINVNGNTPSGNNIEAIDTTTGISIVFSQITTCGITSFEQLSTAPDPPSGFRIVGVSYYEISTTAVYSGLITVAIPYDDSQFNNPNREENLILMHESPTGGWGKITTWVDTINNIIYGECDSLSEFIIVEDSIPPSTTISFEGTKGLRNWYTSSVTVTLTATDEASEVHSIAYSFDGQNWIEYSTPFTVSMEGEFDIYYNATDTQGNVESTKLEPLKIDRPYSDVDKSIISGTKEGYIVRWDYDPSTDFFVVIWEVQYPGYMFFDIALNDTNSDGELEIYASANDGNLVLVRIDYTDGSWLWDWTVPHTVTYGHFHKIFFEDLDDDGVKEIITQHNSRTSSDPCVFIHDPNGNVVATFNPGYRADQIFMADYNGDGVRDLYYMSGASIYSAPQPRILVVDMNDYAMTQLLYFQDSNSGGMTSFVLANIDADDQMEMFTAGWGSPVVAYDHDGTVLWKVGFAGGSADRRLFISPELAAIGRGFVSTASYSTTTLVSYFIDLHTGATISSVSYTAGGSYVVDVFDLNNDGTLEAVIMDYAGSVSYLRFWDLGSGIMWTDQINRRDEFAGVALDNYHQYTDYDEDGIRDLIYVDNNNNLWKASYDGSNELLGVIPGVYATYCTMFLSEGSPYPFTTASLIGTVGLNDWFTSPVEVTFDSVDDYSGVDYTQYSFDEVTWVNYTSPLIISDDGEHTVYFRAVDKAGNKEDTKSISFKIDQFAPSTTATPSGTTGENGWYVSDVYITLDCDDAVSGFAYSEYSFNEVDWFVYSLPIQIQSEGATTVYYRSADLAGNIAPWLPITVNIDTVAPSIPNLGFVSHNPNYWYTVEEVGMQWEASVDDTSGLYGYYLLFDDTSDSVPQSTDQFVADYYIFDVFLSSGIWYAHIRARDVAGNWAEGVLHVGPMKIDAHGPHLHHCLFGDRALNDYFVSDVQVNLYASDYESGVDVLYYCTDGTTWLIYDSPLVLTEEGFHVISYYAIDNLGNSAWDKVIEFTIDKSPPVSTHGISGVPDNSGGYLNEVTVTLSATDLESGFNYIEYRINEGPWQRYASSFILTSGDSYTIDYHAVDVAGNVELFNTVEFTVTSTYSNLLSDHFSTSPDGYDPSLWYLETYGPNEGYWDSDTIMGLSAYGHGHRTLNSFDYFGPGVAANARIQLTDAMANPNWGFTDTTAGGQGGVHGPYNYHFQGGLNGIWLIFNYPYTDSVSFWTMSNGVSTWELVNVDDVTQFHDYTILWDDGLATLLIDGEFALSIDTNVPTVPLQYKMTVTAWWGNPSGQWLYVDMVDIDEYELTDFSLDLIWDTGEIGIVHDIAIGDVDGDNVDETVLTIESSYGAGHVKVYDGTTHVLERTIPMADGFARSLAIGDADGDGDVEIVVGCSGVWQSGPIGRIRVFDGTTGALEWESEPHEAFHTVSVADVDADGTMEIIGIAIVERENNIRTPGRIMIFEGTSKTIEWESNAFGYWVGDYGWIGNIDSDPALEIVFGSRDNNDAPYTTTIWVLDGSTHTVQNSLAIGELYTMCFDAEDIDLDGTIEILVGLRNSAHTVGYLRSYDSSLTLEWEHTFSTGLLPNSIAIANLDSEPTMELVIGIQDNAGGWYGHFQVIDGLYQSNLYTRANKNNAPRVQIGDVNGDGFLDIAVGYHAGFSSGSMEVYATSKTIGQGFPPSSPILAEPVDGDDDGEFTLSWTASVATTYPISHYEIETSKTNSFDTILAQWSSTSTNLLVSNLYWSTYYFRVRAVDSMGTRGYWSNTADIEILRDILAPLIDDPEDIIYEHGTLGNVVTWNPQDPAPDYYQIHFDGIFQYTSNWDGNPIQYSVDGFMPGTYGVTLQVYDVYGNYNTHTVFVSVEPAQFPTIDHPIDVTYEAGSTGNELVWYPSDLTPDYYFIYLNGQVIDSGSWDGTFIPITIDGLDPGTYIYLIEVRDGLGLITSDEVIVTVEDTTPPATSINISGEQDESGWYVSEVSISLTAVDSISGIITIYYSIDGSPYVEYTTPIQYLEEGQHTISYYSVDEAQNVELVNTHEFWIDTIDPETSLYRTGILGENGWYVSELTIVFDAFDADSGVSYIEYMLDYNDWTIYQGSITVSEEGGHSIIFRSIDVASNIEITQDWDFYIDTSEPESWHELVGVTEGTDFYISPVGVILTGYDDVSGIWYIEYKVNSDPWVIYQDPFVISIPEIHIVQYRAIDEAGNVQSSIMFGFEITKLDFPEPPEFLTFEYETSDEEARARIENGEVDLSSGTEFLLYLDALDLGWYNPETVLRNGFGYFIINCDKYPFNETAFRRAFAFALDKERISTEVQDGTSIPQDSPIPQASSFSIEGQLGYNYYSSDYSTAIMLLEEAGFIDYDSDGYRDAPDGSPFEVRIEVADISDIAMGVGYLGEEALQALGINAICIPTDFNDYLSRYISW
ncbi:MAG: OmpL47-type beta-barrel domain-containing protein [Candidatus Thorarchaeota archaeon]